MMCLFVILIIVLFVFIFCMSKLIKKYWEEANKFFLYMQIMKKWLEIRKAGRTLSDYLHEREVHRIAIYGMADLGEVLYEELRDSSIEIVYIIDKRKDVLPDYECKVVAPNEEYEKTDAIIITPVYYYQEIKKMVCRKTDCKIISLEEMILEMLDK